jgi:hypothetical protein
MIMYRGALCKKEEKKLTIKYVSFDDEEAFALAMCSDCWSYAIRQGLSDEDIETIKAELD